jgi:hypothetical protein
MVVSRDYMLKQPSGPSAPKLFLDTKLVPAAVNILGDAEVALNRASLRTGLILGVAGLGSVGLCWMLLRQRPRLESHTPQLQATLRSLD